MSAAGVRRYQISDFLHTRKEQSRASPDEAGVINQYAQLYETRGDDALAPVLLANVNGALMLVDGYHRVRARLKLGKVDVLAKVVEATSEHEAKFLGYLENTRNGLTLTMKDHRAGLALYIKAGRWQKANGRAKTLATIADETGGKVTPMTIYRWIKADHPSVFKCLGKSAQDNGRKQPPLQWSAERTRKAAVIKNLQSVKASLPGLKSDAARAAVQSLIRELHAAVTGGGWPETPEGSGCNDDF